MRLYFSQVYSNIGNLVPRGQVRVNWLCRRQMPWNDGIQECWNNGFRRMRSFFDTIGKSVINLPAANRFLSPPFHLSN